MAAVLPQPSLEVVEELHPAPQAAEDEEIVDLNAPVEPAKPAAPAAAAPAAAPAAPAAPAAAEDDDTPAELRGKTPAQLAKMVRDAQQLIGRQGTELGDLRRRADLYIQASLANLPARQPAAAAPAAPAAAPAAEIDDVDFFAKPKDAIARAIESNPIIKEIRATLGRSAADAETQRALASTERFNQSHPDAGTIMADPEFRTWVGASRVRTQLLHRAHNNFDFDAGDEIFGTWKALRGTGKHAPAAPVADAAQVSVSDAARTMAAAAQAKKKQALADAAAPTGGNASATRGSKKIYRRADVLELMETNRERYDQLAPEIELAYKEGRVR